MHQISRSPFFSIFLCLLVCTFALLADSTPARADSNSGPLPATFDSSQAQSFGLDLTLINATVSISGNGFIRDICNFVCPNINYNLNSGANQNIPISLEGGGVSFTSAPNGSATLGFDHSDPSAAGRTLADLDVDFRNGSDWAFNFAEVPIRLRSDVGNFDVGLKIKSNLNQFLFNQDPGSTAVSPAGGYFASGNISSGIAGTVEARIVDIAFGVDISLADFSFSESSVSNLALPGRATLTPQGGPNPQDLLAVLDLLFPFALEFPFEQTGTSVDNSGSEQQNINYTIKGTLVLSNLAYNLEDTLAGVVIPEPSSFLLAGLGIWSMLASRRRRRPRNPT